MSGESGGVIIGGAVLIAALPVILTGAAIIGTAVGLGALGKVAVQAGLERHRKNQLELDNVSAELDQMYGKLQDAVHQQQVLSEAYDRKTAQELTATAESLRREAATISDCAKLDRMLEQARSTTKRKLQEQRETELNRIRENTLREANAQIHALEQAQRSKLSMEIWKQKTTAAEAGQRAVASSLMRDADSTITLLKNLSDSSGDPGYKQRVQVYEQSYHSLAQAMKAGAYQSVAAGAQNIITGGARLALEFELRQTQKDEIRMALLMRLSALEAELESTGKVEVKTESEEIAEEYLDDFVQGRYSQIQDEVRNLLSEVRSEKGKLYSPQKLQIMLDDVENRLVPQADVIRREANANLMNYYERLRALEIISDYMKGQGYKLDWAQTAGDDAAEKLVVHFAQMATGNTVAVALDRDADSEDIGRMAMEVMFYFGRGRKVSESEKADLRKQLLEALQEKGLRGTLNCTGSVDQEAQDKTMDSQAAVRELPAKRKSRLYN